MHDSEYPRQFEPNHSFHLYGFLRYLAFGVRTKPAVLGVSQDRSCLPASQVGTQVHSSRAEAADATAGVSAVLSIQNQKLL